ncbi:hypothetical protein CsSME_00001970 [Camellia sinensis var. sinensis]
MALWWSTETHTFILGQHEMGPTLEDVSMLLHLEVTGPDAFYSEWIPPEDDSLIQSLKQNLQACGRWSFVFDGSARRTKRVRTDRASYTLWIRHFFRDLQPLARDVDPSSQEYEVGCKPPELCSAREGANCSSSYYSLDSYHGSESNLTK